MNLSTITASKSLPPAVAAWLTNWIPTSSTLKWTTGDGGCFYRSPLAVWEAAYGSITPSVLTLFDERMRQDWGKRGLFSDAIYDSTFDPLMPTAYGKNLWDPLHNGGVTLLDDLDRLGSEWAGNAALRLVSSAYLVGLGQNHDVFYMKDGGKPTQPYMDQGRLRCAGWILHALAGVGRIFKRWGVTGTYADFLVALIHSHLTRIKANWPLVAVADGPDGDHLNVPHLETFMLGMLGNGLERIAALGIVTPELIEMRLAAEKLITAARVGPASYVYDLRVDAAGSPLPKEPMDKIVTGFGGTNMWIVGACTLAERDELLADAKAKQFPAKYPSLFAQFFGSVE